MPNPDQNPRAPRSGGRGAAALLVALALVAAGCGNDNSDKTAKLTDARADLTVAGKVVVTGSSTVEPMSTVAAEAFRGQNRAADVSVEGPGTGDGFARFCEGGADIAGASRPIKAEELEACTAHGIEVVEVPVAYDGISIVVSADNPIDCLSFADLYALLGPEATARGWDDAEPLAAELGSRRSLPPLRLVVTGPGQESGTYDSLVEQVVEPLAEERAAAGALDEADVGRTRLDYAASANDNTIIEGVATDAGGLGWVSFAYGQGVDEVRSVPIAVEPDDPCVAPSETTIQDRTYPIARTLYLYVDAARARDTPAVAAFVDFYLAGLDDFVALAGYVPLADPAEATAVWAERAPLRHDG